MTDAESQPSKKPISGGIGSEVGGGRWSLSTCRDGRCNGVSDGEDEDLRG